MIHFKYVRCRGCGKRLKVAKDVRVFVSSTNRPGEVEWPQDMCVDCIVERAVSLEKAKERKRA